MTQTEGQVAGTMRSGPFDQAAPRYDADASDNGTMRWIRRQSLSSLYQAFPSGYYVLEVGCGTGEEAIANARRGVRVLATDVSSGMVEQLERKLAMHPELKSLITTRVLSAEHLQKLLDEHGAESFDGAYSSLGALNCTGELAKVAANLSSLVKPGGRLVVSLLNKYCLWETTWYLLHLKPALAFRRWSGHASGTALPNGERWPVYYWSAGFVEATFGASFKIVSRKALPWILPPTYAGQKMWSHRSIAGTLVGIEKATASQKPFALLGDHIHYVMVRR